VPICVKFRLSVERSTLKPFSELEKSVHVKVTVLVPVALAISAYGFAGGTKAAPGVPPVGPAVQFPASFPYADEGVRISDGPSPSESAGQGALSL